MRKLLLLIIALLSVAAFAAAGCGGDEQAASGAVELVPSGAFVYGEATLAPEGDQKEAVDSILSKFPGGGQAGDRLKELIEKGLRESDAPVSFKDDIEPWLGDEVAFFVRGVGAAGGPQEAVGLVATDDEDQAQAALEKTAEGKLKKEDYKGVEFLTDDSDQAGAVFDGFLVLGTPLGVRAAIDTSKGDGAKLSDDENYKQALEDAADDRLGFVYVDTPQVQKLAQQGGGAGAFPDSFKQFLKDPVVATFDADNDGVVVEGSVSADVSKSLGFGEGSDLLGDMPADSWLALAQTDFGKLLDYYVDAFAGVAGGRDVIEQQLRAATGLDLQKDVIDWMGDFGVFARGSSVPELDGALVIETSDEGASGRFIAALARLAKSESDGSVQIGPLAAPGGGDGFSVRGQGIPKPVHVFQRDGLVVFAYGDAAAKDATDAGAKLGDDSDFKATRDSLGDYEVAFYMQMQPIFDLVDSTEAANDADWQRAKPYLEPLSALVGGSSGDGDSLKSAFKLVVK
jgi:Protein of unknown function (DUF3352)